MKGKKAKHNRRVSRMMELSAERSRRRNSWFYTRPEWFRKGVEWLLVVICFVIYFTVQHICEVTLPIFPKWIYCVLPVSFVGFYFKVRTSSDKDKFINIMVNVFLLAGLGCVLEIFFMSTYDTVNYIFCDEDIYVRKAVVEEKIRNHHRRGYTERILVLRFLDDGSVFQLSNDESFERLDRMNRVNVYLSDGFLGAPIVKSIGRDWTYTSW